jgi:hypothetical protein
MADFVYPAFKQKQNNGNAIDLDTDTIKIMLVTSTYTPATAHDFRDDVTNEVTGTGYTTGGVALANKTITASGNNYIFDADDPAWASSTITARGAVLYKSVGTAATDPLICYLDFGSNITSTNGTFTVAFNASGIISFQ